QRGLQFRASTALRQESSQAANYAYGKAREIDPSNPGADFFLGTALFQSGQIIAARETWARLLANSPDGAPWKPEIEARVARLDEMIANAPMLQ
ncbi:MAG: tetratricopeptide repeat protein, partial [Pseudomonadota bacterium]